MNSESSPTLYTVIITGLRSGANKASIADGIARIVKNMDAARVLRKLDALPWTMTRKASRKNAERLSKYLQKIGCDVQVVPPLEIPISDDVGETQILPQTSLLTESQVISSTQFVPVPEQTERAEATSEETPPPPPPTEPPKQDEKPTTVLEPLSLAGILDQTFQICRNRFWKLLAIAAIPYCIMIALIILAGIIALIFGLTDMSFIDDFTPALLIAGIFLIPTALVLFIALFYSSQGALIFAVSVSYLGKQISVRESYNFVFARLAKFILTSLLFTIMILLSLALAVTIGIVLFFVFQAFTSSGWWSAFSWLPLMIIPFYVILKLLLFDKIVIVENVAYMGALSRSWNLLSGKAAGSWPRGYALRLFLLTLLFMLIAATISWVFQTPAALLTAFLPLPEFAKTVLTQLLGTIGSLIATVFAAVCMVVFYYDVRNRKEGFDLQMLAEMTSDTISDE
ncbi:hypothetical protein [Desulfomonile tiedjei]|uniref:Glycerophosphoryl diester phosphodiesterase membrane domain-containing protein n=1 Tax=Desulfomonile tiedjei (strain ATCC 49306 / DSM 6799 / DCB-1) TaxID=706587 RepID=I4CDI1_DESTA|nr:hypothetical protein [Desulfomonile tiedjei]AFM27622.1 hypothetical protein Desti_5010 [Desulfomonile tiedjei DSM 6799]